MREMKRLRFTAVIEIPEDTFSGEFGSEAYWLLCHFFEHGDASGDFYTYSDSDVTIEDFEETE